MTTSGTSTWNPPLLYILKQALLNASAISEDEEPAFELYETALLQLNGIVKSAEATGLHVWTEEEAILFLEVGKARYTIGGPAPDAHTSDAADWLRITVSAAAAPGATAVLSNDAALLAEGMHLGLVLDDGTTQWTTIASLSGTTINLGDALTGTVDAGAFGLAYTTAINRPLKIPRARQLYLQSLNETAMTILSRQEYMDLPNKTTPGAPNQWFYSPRRDEGLFYVWNPPNWTQWAVRFTWYRALQDFLVPTDTSDFPQEWVNPLIWRLALEIAPSYGVPEATWNRLKTMSAGYDDLVESYDRESEPIQFGMDYPLGAPR